MPNVNLKQKIRIMELRGTYKGGGGPDKTILLSAAKHDLENFFLLVTYLRDPEDDEFQIGAWANRLALDHYVEVLDRRILDLKCLTDLNRLIRRFSIQIVHVHDLKTTLLGFFLKLLNPDIRIMHTAHGWIINSRTDRIKQLFQFLMLKMYPFHIAVSEITRKIMVRHGINKKSIVVLYNAIDTDYWSRANGCPGVVRKEFGIPEDRFLIGTVCRLSKEKDFITYLEVAANIIKRNPNVHFLIVGDGKGNIVEELHSYADELGIGNHVIFAGHRTDLLNIYASFDLFLMTTLTEGLPNTVLEAMTMELPTVLTNVGGIPELVTHNETGVLCEVKNVPDITSKIMHLIENRTGRGKLGENARQKIVEKFSFEKRLQKIETYYRMVVGVPRR